MHLYFMGINVITQASIYEKIEAEIYESKGWYLFRDKFINMGREHLTKEKLDKVLHKCNVYGMFSANEINENEFKLHVIDLMNEEIAELDEKIVKIKKESVYVKAISIKSI